MAGPGDEMEMPALGRPFRLGMLYNCYKDALLLGHSLIDSKTCDARTERIKQATSVREQIPSDTIRKRAAALDIKPSLLTSLLCGLFEADGCAKYLLSAKKFRHPGILTYRSLAMERFEKLDLNNLAPKHFSPHKIGKCAATHVVTGVWYGDQAIWDCDQEVPASEKVQENARRTDVENAASPEQGKAPSKTIKLHLGESEERNAPIKICLYPLRNLELKMQCASSFHEIRDTLNSEIVDEMDALLEIEARCNDLLNSPAATTFPEIGKKLHQFRDLCEQHKRDFQKQLAEMVPLVREGKKEEKDLEEVLKRHKQSPFGTQRLNQFLDEKEQEITIVNSVLSSLKEIKAISFQKELLEKFYDPNTDFVIILMFTSLNEEEPYFSELRAFLSSSEQPETNQKETQSSTKWYEDQAVIRRVKEVAKSFLAFAHANQSSKKTQFLVASVQDESNPGASIYLYENGVLEKNNFEPLSKPQPLEIEEISQNKVRLRLTPAPSGKDAISCYQVEGRTVGQGDWELWVTSGKEETVTVTDLCPDTEYEFRYATVSKPGISESSDVCRAVRTLPAISDRSTKETQEGSSLVAGRNEDTKKEERNSDSTMLTRDEGNKSSSDQSTKRGIENVGGPMISLSHSLLNDANPKAGSGNTVAVKRFCPDPEYKIHYAAVSKPEISKSSDVCKAERTLPAISPRSIKETHGGSPACFPGSQDIKAEEENADHINTRTPMKNRVGQHSSKESPRGEMEIVGGPQTSASNPFSDDGTTSNSNPKEESESLAISLCRVSEIIRKGQPSLYVLPLEKSVYSGSESCVKYTFGRRDNPQVNHKVVMFLGETGAGKSTLINRMMNHIFGVRWEDDFRYNIIQDGAKGSQAHSQTDRLTVYEINGSQGLHIPSSLTLIDTPGFGDTRGINHDKRLMEEIRSFFSLPGGIDHIDAVCLVVQASQARLTQSQKYIFDEVFSIFGKDIRDNILILITFADGKAPPVLQAIEESDMPCARDVKGFPIHFTFNNSALFASNVPEDEDSYRLTQKVWEIGETNMAKFFQTLNVLGPQSLTLTSEVLNERKELEATLQSMKPQVQMTLVELGKLEKLRKALEKHPGGMKAKRNLEYELEKVVKVRKDISDQKYRAVNCLLCEYTCFYPCHDPSNSGKLKDNIIDKDSGLCLVCPHKCSWQAHRLEGYKWDYCIKTERQSFAQLKEKYLVDSYGTEMTEKKAPEWFQHQYDQVFGSLVKLIETSSHHLQRLQQTALRPNRITAPEYIDLLISLEEKERQPGYAERIGILKSVKGRILPHMATFLQHPFNKK